MSSRSLVVVAVLVMAAPPARGDEAADARAIVARAVKAAGWKADGKNFNMTWKDNGNIQFGGMKLDYTANWAVRLPDALRFELTAEVMGQKFDLIHVVNGDKVWDASMGMTQEVTGEKKEYSLEELYQLRVLSLTPLLNDKSFTLSSAGEQKIGDKPAAGVKVEHKGRSPMTLWFDKETGLLVKSEAKVKDEFQGWKEVTEEAHFEDWKDTGKGFKAYTKIRLVRDGKPFIESKLSDLRMPEKLDPKLFEKP